MDDGIPEQYQVPFTPIDSGAYHPTFQDYRFEVKYNVIRKGVVVTPVVAFVTPSHDYPYFGHSAVGRDLKELQTGVVAAKVFRSGVPGLLVQGHYGYGFTEKVLDVSHNRSLMDLEVGYFFTDKLRVMALGSGQVTHGGPDITRGWRTDFGPLAPHHDQVTRDNFASLGAAVAYTLNDKLDLYGSAMRMVAARNGHVIDHALTTGVSWSFVTSRSKGKTLSAAAGDGKEAYLVKCVCEKNAGMR